MTTTAEKMKKQLIDRKLKELEALNPRLTKLLLKLIEYCRKDDFDNFTESFKVSSLDKMHLLGGSITDRSGIVHTLIAKAITRVSEGDARFFDFIVKTLKELKDSGEMQKALGNSEVLTNDLINQLFTLVGNGSDQFGLLTMLGAYEAIDALIKLGVDPNNSKAFFNTTIPIEIDQNLINQGSKSIKVDRLKILKLFLEMGVRPHTITIQHSNPPFVLLIVQNNDLDALQVLTTYCQQNPEHGINFNEFSKVTEITPLKWVAYIGNTEMAKLLIGAGADPNLQTEYLKTKFDKHGFPTQALIQYNAQTDQHEINNAGPMTPLMLAANQGHAAIIPCLITTTNINLQNREGATALHVAGRHPIVVQLLLAAGARADIADNEGNTPIVYPITNINNDDNITKTAQLLIDKLDVTQCYAQYDNQQYTLPVLAAGLGKLNILKLLLDSIHKNKKVLDEKQINDILVPAIKNKFPDIVELILKTYPSSLRVSLKRHLFENEFLTCAPLKLAVVWYASLDMQNEKLTEDELNRILIILKILLRYFRINTDTYDIKMRQEFEFKLVLFSAKFDALPLVKFFIESGVNIAQHFPNKDLLEDPFGDPNFVDVWPLPILTRPKKLATMQYLLEYCKTNHAKEFIAWKNNKYPVMVGVTDEKDRVNPAGFIAYAYANFETFAYLFQEGVPFVILQLFMLLSGGKPADDFPDFKQKIAWALQYLFTKECENKKINLDSSWNLAIQRLSSFLTEWHENLSFKKDDLKFDLRFLITIERTSIEVNISSHLNSILKALVQDLPKNSGSQFVEKQIRRILCCYVGSETSPVESLAASQSGLKEQENFEEVLLTIRDFDKTRDSIKRLNETILDKAESTQFNLQSSIHNTQFHAYYAKYPDKKTEHEKDNTEWQEQLSKIYKDLEEINKTPFLPPKTEDIGAWKKALEKVKTQSDKLLNCLKLLNSLQALVNDRVKMQEEQNKVFVAAATTKAEDKSDKRKKHKSKPKKSKPAAKKEASSGDGDDSFVKLKQHMNEFGSKLEALQLAARRYLDPLKEAAEKAEQERREARQKQKIEDFKEVMDGLTLLGYATTTSKKNFGLPHTLDSITNISGRLERLELVGKTKGLLDLPQQEDYEKIWKTWMWVGRIAQVMESAKDVLNTVLSTVAARLRDLLFYTVFEDKDLSLEELSSVVENVSRFLSQESSATSKKTYSSVSDLLKEIDPDPAVLSELFEENQQKPINITVDFCETQIKRGLKRLAECRNKFFETQGECNQTLLLQALGTTFALIGNFASHLRIDFASDPEKKEAMEAFRKVNGECRNIDENLTLSKCINIGKLYRHLNKRLIKDKETHKVISREPVDKDHQWETQLNVMIERWRQELTTKPRKGFTPYHDRAFTAAIASRPDSGSLSLSSPSSSRAGVAEIDQPVKPEKKEKKR